MKQLNRLIPETGKPITFEEFYSAYPKKTEKVKAEMEWNKLSDIEKHSAFIDIPNRLEHHSQWQTKSFIPSPRRFLLRKLWTDEIVKDKTRAEKQQDKEQGDLTPLSRFWNLLDQMYGEKLLRAHGEVMPRLWRIKLKDITHKQITHIINYLEVDYSKYDGVPDLPKITMIKSIGDRSWETEKPLLALDNPSKDSTVRIALEEMKEILR